jgi:hypothetical protein
MAAVAAIFFVYTTAGINREIPIAIKRIFIILVKKLMTGNPY